jgi:hypothetical protein
VKHASRLTKSRLAGERRRNRKWPALAPEFDTEAFAAPLRRNREYSQRRVPEARVPAPDKPFTIACQTGRLVELRLGMLASREQIAEMKDAISDMLHGVTDAVVCVDLRGGRLLPEHLADAILSVMREDNHLFRACAALVSSPMLALQMMRLVREAANPSRRIFDTPGELVLWLRTYLTREEFDRMVVFVNERSSTGGNDLRGASSNTPT